MPYLPADIPVSPVTKECVVRAAHVNRIPLALLVTIMGQESGQVGQYRRNKNKTIDMGPMQINSVWLKKLKKFNIDKAILIGHGCINVYVGAAILSAIYKETGGDIWKTIARYHSRTPKYQQRYTAHVKRKLAKRQIDFNAVIKHANKISDKI